VYSNAGHNTLAKFLDKFVDIIAVVSYEVSFTPQPTKSGLLHCAGKVLPTITSSNVAHMSYNYTEAKSGNFVIPNHEDFQPSSAAVAHTRTLSFLKRYMDGPTFDLEAIWEEHTMFEFGNRSVANTMGTMVQEPYVNHIPTVNKLLSVIHFQN